MQPFRKTVLLMIPAFVFIALFASTSFAGGKKWKKHKGDISYSQGHHYDCDLPSQGHHYDCDLPPGLAKKGKVPPGWNKKCRNQEVKHHAKKHQDPYPDHKRSSGSHDKPTVEGGVDIGFGVHIPFP
jgi:hypothetical protein